VEIRERKKRSVTERSHVLLLRCNDTSARYRDILEWALTAA
jgi:hypothetical protein